MKSRILHTCLLLLLVTQIFSQVDSGEHFLMFYNVENLFDIQDDPETADEEFTPDGARRWTYSRFNRKLISLSKVILNAAGWAPPEMIALCEVENRYVLECLLKDTPLQKYPYKIIHKDSPDIRGIDVAFIYNEQLFYPIKYSYVPLKTRDDSVIKTREILYVSGIINDADTLHIFANHWPSRYSGLLESQPLRNLAAQTLRTQIEMLQSEFHNPKIVVVGDFNDQPTDESLSVHLGTVGLPGNQRKIDPVILYNLSLPWTGKEPGTLKYQSQWSVFDQIIVSGSLLNINDKLYTKPEWARIVKLPFLFEKDERYGGQKIKRTYNGFRYAGGYSDHLPVLLKINTNP